MSSRIDQRKFKKINRRELLKLSPVLVLGAFAVPKLQGPLLTAVLGFSDWASAKLCRPGHPATTFVDSHRTRFEIFPRNTYDVDDPEVGFDIRKLTVSGEV